MSHDSVIVYVYDLSHGMAKQMSPMIIGKTIEGIWHTSVVLRGREYYYGGIGIEHQRPGTTVAGTPLQKLTMGSTQKDQRSAETYLDSIREKFSPSKYNVLQNNCNNFTDDFCFYLTGKHIPSHIINLPQEVMSTPMGRQLMPLFDSMGQGMSMPGMGMQNAPMGSSYSANVNRVNSFSASVGSSANVNRVNNFSANVSSSANVNRVNNYGANVGSDTNVNTVGIESCKKRVVARERFIFSRKPDPNIGRYVEAILQGNELNLTEKEIHLVKELPTKINPLLAKEEEISSKTFLLKNLSSLIGIIDKSLFPVTSTTKPPLSQKLSLSLIALLRLLVVSDVTFLRHFGSDRNIETVAKLVKSDSSDCLKIVALSFLCSLFSSSDEQRLAALSEDKRIIQSVAETVYSEDNRLIRLAASSLLANCANGLCETANEDEMVKLIILLGDRVLLESDNDIRSMLKSAMRNLLKENEPCGNLSEGLGFGDISV